MTKWGYLIVIYGGYMKKLLVIMAACFTLLVSQNAKAEIGINAGFGIPFVSQYGLNATFGPKWSANIGYNSLDITSSDADVKLTMPEVVVNWHPFSGAFFIGLGLGSEKLEVSASNAAGSASAEVTATTTIAKLGWMWGKADGGFWFGMDISFISPSGGEVDIKTTGAVTTASEEYQEAKDAAEKFGETAYTNITFARLGYLF